MNSSLSTELFLELGGETMQVYKTKNIFIQLSFILSMFHRTPKIKKSGDEEVDENDKTVIF